ncbi:MAG: tyrosine-type recombinase/integrase, partial [Erythrobacter sp.]|nr:tyrosine-type recombinase/integrase [Erythrobacter sp.]
MSRRPDRQRKRRVSHRGSQALLTWNDDLLAQPGSLQDLMRRFLDWQQVRNYSPATLKTRTSVLLLFAHFCEERGLVVARDIARPHIERYQAFLARYRKPDGKPLSVRTQCSRLHTLRVFFTWAVKQHFLPANPASDLDMPRPTKPIPVFLTAEEVRRVFALPDVDDLTGLRDRAILEVLYSTGIRRAEAAALRVDDIDAEAGLVRINRGKGGKDRLIPIGLRALGWLDRYQENARLVWHRDVSVAELFLDADGGPMTPGQVSAIVGRYLKTAEITKPGCCHLFRHTFATALLNAGCDMRYIKDMLGHANMNTTAHYAQVSVERLKQMHAAFHP